MRLQLSTHTLQHKTWGVPLAWQLGVAVAVHGVGRGVEAEGEVCLPPPTPTGPDKAGSAGGGGGGGGAAPHQGPRVRGTSL